jgi:hypothetical protein
MAMRQISHRIRTRTRQLVTVAAVAGALLIATGSTVGASPPQKFQLTVGDDFSGGTIEFVVATVPPVLPAGTYKVGLANNSVAPHVLVAVGGLPAGMTVEEFIAGIDAVTAGAPPPEGLIFAGNVFAKSGQDHQKQFDLTTPGQYGYFCPIVSPDGTPHYKEGFVGLFEVVAG